MNVKSQKKLAAKVMKVGLSRVRIMPAEGKDVSEAITRNDIRNLVSKGAIKKIRKRGSCKIDSKFRREQKRKGRKKGHGSRKGAYYSRKKKKAMWMEKVRPLRKLLRELRDSGRLEKNEYRKLYLSVKGGLFRNKKHLLYYLKEHELLKEVKGKGKKTEKPEKKGEKG